jgi:hypothetical protein
VTIVPQPRELVFYSWWFEERVKRYLEVKFDMSSHLFSVVLDKAVALSDIALRDKLGRDLDVKPLRHSPSSSPHLSPPPPPLVT